MRLKLSKQPVEKLGKLTNECHYFKLEDGRCIIVSELEKQDSLRKGCDVLFYGSNKNSILGKYQGSFIGCEVIAEDGTPYQFAHSCMLRVFAMPDKIPSDFKAVHLDKVFLEVTKKHHIKHRKGKVIPVCVEDGEISAGCK